MEAVLRRARAQGEERPVSEVRAGDLVLNLESHEATKAGQLVQLTPLEFRIAYLLAMNEGRVIPYSRLVEYAWGYDGGDANVLKTHVSHLRTKLGRDEHQPGGIRAVSGVGYVLSRG